MKKHFWYSYSSTGQPTLVWDLGQCWYTRDDPLLFLRTCDSSNYTTRLHACCAEWPEYEECFTFLLFEILFVWRVMSFVWWSSVILDVTWQVYKVVINNYLFVLICCFCTQEHFNYFAMDDTMGPLVLSVKNENVPSEEHIRIILRWVCMEDQGFKSS